MSVIVFYLFIYCFAIYSRTSIARKYLGPSKFASNMFRTIEICLEYVWDHRNLSGQEAKGGGGNLVPGPEAKGDNSGFFPSSMK